MIPASWWKNLLVIAWRETGADYKKAGIEPVTDLTSAKSRLVQAAHIGAIV
jgi:hypothetical protein